MFCKNCGNSINPGASFCTSCGASVGNGNKFCPNCGSACDPAASVCTNCGFSLGFKGGERKSKLAAGLLGLFLGGFGIHNFYLGFTKKAIIQIVVSVITCGIGSIWGFIEGILILCGTNIVADADGQPLE